MPRGNPDKLIPANRRSKQEASDLGRKGGIKSGEVRREKKRFSQIQAEFLADAYDIVFEEGEKAQKLTGEQLLREVQRRILMRCDSASVSMIKEIREGKEGNKLALSGELDLKTMTPEERKARIEELAKKRKNATK